MTTEKQLIANQQNAQLSTGPSTTAGKTAIAGNAIKHGIFTKDLIISSQIGQENLTEYEDLLNSLIDSLSPCNQLESLLVEKIAIDFWRIRRVIRFETGSVKEHISSLLRQFYSSYIKDNKTIDKEVANKQQQIDWNTQYMRFLADGEVSFDQPVWNGGTIYSEIFEDFIMIAKSIETLTKAEKDAVYNSYDLTLADLRHILENHDYVDNTKISLKLVELLTKQNQNLQAEIQRLSEQKQLNEASDKLTYMLGMLPAEDNFEKVMKYERSLQKSILHNLLMLKKLQGIF